MKEGGRPPENSDIPVDRGELSLVGSEVVKGILVQAADASVCPFQNPEQFMTSVLHWYSIPLHEIKSAPQSIIDIAFRLTPAQAMECVQYIFSHVEELSTVLSLDEIQNLFQVLMEQRLFTDFTLSGRKILDASFLDESIAAWIQASSDDKELVSILEKFSRQAYSYGGTIIRELNDLLYQRAEACVVKREQYQNQDGSKAQPGPVELDRGNEDTSVAVGVVNREVAGEVAKKIEYRAEGLESSLEGVNVSQKLKELIISNFHTVFAKRFFDEIYSADVKEMNSLILGLTGAELKSFIAWAFDRLPSLDVRHQDTHLMVNLIVLNVTAVGSHKQSLLEAFSLVVDPKVKDIMESFRLNLGAFPSNFGARSRSVGYAYSVLLKDFILGDYNASNLDLNRRRNT